MDLPGKRMHRLTAALLAIVIGGVGQATACNLPPGPAVPPQQWFVLCQSSLMEVWLRVGAQRGVSFGAFTQAMYGFYVQANPIAATPIMPMPGPMPRPLVIGSCPAGAQQCFSGYVRTCETLASGYTMWKTSARTCR